MKKQHHHKSRKIPTLPLSLRIVRGAIGKEFVIKHYRWGIIKTKYPDMTRIIASAGQRSCRNLFKEAVAYAKKVMADTIQKKAWRKRVRHKHRVFNQIIKAYMLEAKKAAKERVITGKYLLRFCFKTATTTETVMQNELQQLLWFDEGLQCRDALLVSVPP